MTGYVTGRGLLQSVARGVGWQTPRGGFDIYGTYGDIWRDKWTHSLTGFRYLGKTNLGSS